MKQKVFLSTAYKSVRAVPPIQFQLSYGTTNAW
jgi:hypothetical protein